MHIFFGVIIALALGTGPVLSGSDDLAKFLLKVPATDIFASADGYGEVMADKPIVPVIKNGKTVGYVFLNTDFSGSIGYSGKPIKILIGLDQNGHIAGAKLVKHTEPIILAGIPEKKITDFIEAYKSLDTAKIAAADTTDNAPPADIVSGATVTVLVIDDSIRRASVRVARLLGLAGLTPISLKTATVKKTVIRTMNDIKDWQTLTGEGSVRRLKLSVGEINAAFGKSGNAIAIERAEPGLPGDTFIDLYVASLSVPGIAKSLIGEAEYASSAKAAHVRSRGISYYGKRAVFI